MTVMLAMTVVGALNGARRVTTGVSYENEAGLVPARPSRDITIGSPLPRLIPDAQYTEDTEVHEEVMHAVETPIVTVTVLSAAPKLLPLTVTAV